MDLHEQKEKDPLWTIAEVKKAALTYDKELVSKTKALNKKLTKKQRIRFYGARSSAAEGDEAEQISYVADHMANNMVSKEDLNLFKQEVRNETQAIIQHTVATAQT